MHQSVWRVSPFWRSDQFVSAVTATRGLASAWALWVDTDVRAPCRFGASRFDDAIRRVPLHLHGVSENGMPTMKKKKSDLLLWVRFPLGLTSPRQPWHHTMPVWINAEYRDDWHQWNYGAPSKSLKSVTWQISICGNALYSPVPLQAGRESDMYFRDLMTSINASHFCSVALPPIVFLYFVSISGFQFYWTTAWHERCQKRLQFITAGGSIHHQWWLLCSPGDIMLGTMYSCATGAFLKILCCTIW